MDPQLELFSKVARSSKDGGTGEDNPFVPFIEAMVSNDKSLLDQGSEGYQVIPGGPPNDPDTVLMDANKAAKEERSALPCTPSLLSRKDVLQDYELLYNIAKETKAVSVKQMIRIQPPHFVRSPLESLTPVLLSDMMLHKVHKGSYLICRTISRAVRMVAVQVAIKDQSGNVAELALYNSFDTAGLDRDAIAELIPIGQVILVREPWFKPGATGGNPTIRVDAPTDVSFLEFNDPMLQDFPATWTRLPKLNADDYKLKGNEAFKKNHWEVAIRAYTTGLAVDPSASLLRLNRSLCYLKLGSLSLALNDARIAYEDKALASQSRNKARYRMASVLYAMDRFKGTLEILTEENLVQFSPQDVRALRKKAQDRFIEQTQGSYDWFALSKLFSEGGEGPLVPDVADYVGPVKVAPMSNMGGGRGLVTTRPVVAGELLMVAKPFAFASPIEFPELLRALHPDRNNITERAYHEVVGRAVRRLMGDYTASSSLFLDLHPGEDYDPLQPTEVVPRTPNFLANGAQHWLIPSEHPILDIDINRVEGVITSNSFGDGAENSEVGKTEAIYSLPSLMNHSCHGTAVRSHFGSLVVVRAARDISEGDEVTCSYIAVGNHIGSTYLSREPKLKKWIDSCQCELCSSDRQDGNKKCQEREEYGDELEKLMNQLLHPADMGLASSIRALVLKIESTYRTGRKEPMDTLGLAQQGLAFMSLQSPETIVQAYIATLRSHGVGVKESPPSTVPQNRFDMRKDFLIIQTSHFPSQFGTIWKCIKVMQSLASFQYKHGKYDLASHWAVACLWTHEAFYGPSNDYLWHTLSIQDPSRSAIAQILKRFE